MSGWWGFLGGLLTQLAVSAAAWWSIDDGMSGLSVPELGGWAATAGTAAVAGLVVGLSLRGSWRWRRFGVMLIAGTYAGAAVFSTLLLPRLL